MNPKPIPFVIDQVNGMIMITSAAESPIARSWKSIPASLRVDGSSAFGSASPSASVSELISSPPTMISAGAVACGGTIPISGARKRKGKKSAPVTTLVQPVRPPAATPAPDSMYVVAEDEDAAPPPCAEDDRDRETEDRGRHRPRREVAELDRQPWRGRLRDQA